jgi:hypothetical protein
MCTTWHDDTTYTNACVSAWYYIILSALPPNALQFLSVVHSNHKQRCYTVHKSAKAYIIHDWLHTIIATLSAKCTYSCVHATYQRCHCKPTTMPAATHIPVVHSPDIHISHRYMVTNTTQCTTLYAETPDALLFISVAYSNHKHRCNTAHNQLTAMYNFNALQHYWRLIVICRHEIPTTQWGFQQLTNTPHHIMIYIDVAQNNVQMQSHTTKKDFIVTHIPRALPRHFST